VIPDGPFRILPNRHVNVIEAGSVYGDRNRHPVVKYQF
jgi:hypothetical protein